MMNKRKKQGKGPGKYYRKGLSWVEFTRRFPDDESAEKWFIASRWPHGVHCPGCGSDNVQVRKTRKPQPYRCRDCRKDFSVKTDTLMHNSPLGCQIWAMAIYLLTTGIKGVSSMKLHRDLGITQKSAWHLAHRIRENFPGREGANVFFSGQVEVDETYIGGKERNKHSNKKLNAGRGSVGKTAVVRYQEQGNQQSECRGREQYRPGESARVDLCDDDCSTLICSPPYGDERNGVSYAQFSRNMLAWLGYTPQALRQSKALTLGWGKDERTAPVSPTLSRALGAITAFPDSGREAVAFYADYQAALAEMARVTSGAIVIVIGQRVLRDTVFDNGAITTELMQQIGVPLVESFSRKLPTKRLPKMRKFGAAINRESILVFRK